MSWPWADLKIGNDEIPWSFLEWEIVAGSVRSALQVRPTKIDQSWDFTQPVFCDMGLITQGGNRSLWKMIDGGRIVSATVGINPPDQGPDTLELTVDNADARFEWAPEKIETNVADSGGGGNVPVISNPADPNGSTLFLELEDLVDFVNYVYQEKLSFEQVATNLPNIPFDEVVFDPGQSYHQTMVSLMGGLRPVFFPDAHANALAIYDTRRALPEGLPVRVLTSREYRLRRISYQINQPINSVDMTFWKGGTAGDEDDDLTMFEREVEVTAEGPAGPGGAGPITIGRTGFPTPADFPRSRIWEKFRYWTNQDGEIVKITTLGQRSEDYDSDGVLLMRTTTEITYVPGTGDTIEKQRVTKKRARIRYITGNVGEGTVRETKEEKVWGYNAYTGNYELVAEYGLEKGFVVMPDLVPWDEASRNQTVAEGVNQTIEYKQISHTQTSYLKLSPSLISRTHKEWDDLRKGVRVQVSETVIGSDQTQRARPTASTVVEDPISISLDGRRPRQQFDARPYGPVLGRQLIQEQIFDRRLIPDVSDDVQLAYFDPSFTIGELLELRDRSNTPFYYLTTGVRHSLDFTQIRSNIISALTFLRCIRIAVV